MKKFGGYWRKFLYFFAECQSRHSAKFSKCRVPGLLHSALYYLCRVPHSRHSANSVTCTAHTSSQGRYAVATNVPIFPRPLPLLFAECQLDDTRQKHASPSASLGHSAFTKLCRVSALALGKQIQKLSPNSLQTFSSILILCERHHI